MLATRSFTKQVEATAEQCLPAFVRARMDEHYIDRIEKLLGGEHMHQWRPPGPDAIYVASNNYLFII